MSFRSVTNNLMKIMICGLLITSFCLFFAACATNTPNPAEQTNTPATPSTDLPGEVPPEVETPQIPTESPSPEPQQPEETFSQYVFSAVLDYNTHILQVEQQINYVNHTGVELLEILLLVEPNRYPGGFILNSLGWENGEPIEAFNLNVNELLIPLSLPVQPGETVGISLSYILTIPQQNDPYGFTERQTNLGDWYPYVPPYVQGEGWLVRDDAFLGEHLAYEMAEFAIEIQLAEPFSANGGELIIAASSLPVIEQEVYRYQHGPARNFAWTVSDLYIEQEILVGDVLVKSYSFPYHPQADTPALEETAKSVAIFSEIFEPYPHQTLSVVEADFLDGMEYDGLVFLSHAFYDYYTGGPESNLTIIAAHEVAHQWWYGLVGNDQALEPWLDEAFSTFSEVLFYEQAYPDLVDWWWENRINFHNPQGWVDSTIYEAEGFYPYRDAVYLRGAQFLAEIRDILGADRFQEFLRDYLSKYRHKQVRGDDFFNLLSEYTSEDISPLVSQYFTKR
jgi:hypothetical protein